jgi:hypothetical protein
MVVALGVSPKMVRFAKRRLGTKARILEADIVEPLDCLADACLDPLLSALALGWLKDWTAVFRSITACCGSLVTLSFRLLTRLLTWCQILARITSRWSSFTACGRAVGPQCAWQPTGVSQALQPSCLSGQVSCWNASSRPRRQSNSE